MLNAVALVPGFLGFDRRAGRTYFADRFLAALRARLEATCGGPIAVVPTSTLPIGSLADRQRRLLGDLEKLDASLGKPAWHLVGHSSGGLDAAMLARTETLVAEGKRPSRFSGQPLAFERLGSVTTIAAPHHGTCLAVAPLTLMSRGEGVTLPALQALFAGARDVVQRDAFWSRVHFALGSLVVGGLPGFLAHLLFGDELARDLDPAVASALTTTQNRRRGVRLFSIATAAPAPGPDLADRLFRDLWTWTQEKANDPALPAPPPFPALQGARVIARSPASAPPVTPTTNDGVVNTDRQVDGEFAGLVVADHGDVIGQYQRRDLLDGEPLDTGLLTSGADFGDDEFFALIGLVADGIARTIQGR